VARHASSLPTGMAFRRRLKQTGVEPQSCDETDMAANRGDQIEGREAESATQRRSIVSSNPITTGPTGKNRSRIIVSSGGRWRDCSIVPG